MLNPIDEMRRLSSKRYEELFRLAVSNFGFCPNGHNYSKVEIITYIVTITALRDRFADMIAKPQDGLTKYRITERDHSEHYLMLTPEQERFIKWNMDHCIDYNTADIDILEDIDWETP